MAVISLSDVELIDTSQSKNYSLPKPADLPTRTVDLVANLADDQVVACGGYNIYECYTYSFTSNTWTQTMSMDVTRT